MKQPTIAFKGKPTTGGKLLILCTISFGQFRTEKNTRTFIITDKISNQRRPRTDEVEEKFYKPIVISTGLSLPCSFWKPKNEKFERAIGSYSNYNDKLKEIEQNIFLLFESFPDNISPEIIKKELTKIFDKEKKKSVLTKAADKVIEKRKASTVLETGKVLAMSTFAPRLFSELIHEKLQEEFKRGTLNEKSSGSQYKQFAAKFAEYEKHYEKVNGQLLFCQNLTDTTYLPFELWVRKT